MTVIAWMEDYPYPAMITSNDTRTEPMLSPSLLSSVFVGAVTERVICENMGTITFTELQED